MNEDLLSVLRDTLLRRDLTSEEEIRLADWLRQNPGRVADWRAEAALARGLRRIPNAPVPSNFTMRVIAEVEREAAAASRRRLPWLGRLDWRSGWRRWATALGVAGLVVLGGIFQQMQQVHRRQEYVRHVAALRALSQIPPSVLEDFEAIRRFQDSSAPVDYELLAALQ